MGAVVAASVGDELIPRIFPAPRGQRSRLQPSPVPASSWFAAPGPLCPLVFPPPPPLFGSGGGSGGEEGGVRPCRSNRAVSGSTARRGAGGGRRRRGVRRQVRAGGGCPVPAPAGRLGAGGGVCVTRTLSPSPQGTSGFPFPARFHAGHVGVVRHWLRGRSVATACQRPASHMAAPHLGWPRWQVRPCSALPLFLTIPLWFLPMSPCAPSRQQAAAHLWPRARFTWGLGFRVAWGGFPGCNARGFPEVFPCVRTGRLYSLGEHC